MIPVALNPARLRLAVLGQGPSLDRRVALLVRGNAEVAHLNPEAPNFAGIDVLWITGLPPGESTRLATEARGAGVLVNVEDQPGLCDFHSVAELRRGPLLVGVSTGGESPGLARRVRDRIAALLGPDWGERVSRLGSLRRRWRAQGHSIDELARLTNDEIDRAGWLA